LTAIPGGFARATIVAQAGRGLHDLANAIVGARNIPHSPLNRPLQMKPRITLAIVDKLHSTIDSATRLHRLGLLLFVLACVCVSLPQAGMPRWMQLAGLLATGLAFVIKAAGTLREIRLAKVLRQVMGMPRRRLARAHGSDLNAWAAMRTYVVVSVVLTVAAALTPSMLAASGATFYAHLTVMFSMAALVIQSVDNTRRLHDRVLLICGSRLDPHANDDVLAA
jgi:hypothetical protein